MNVFIFFQTKKNIKDKLSLSLFNFSDSFKYLKIFSLTMGKYLVKTFRKNQKYVPKVFSGFEKWTFICPLFCPGGVQWQKNAFFEALPLCFGRFFEEKKTVTENFFEENVLHFFRHLKYRKIARNGDAYGYVTKK